MKLTGENFYIIKKSDNSIWKFSFKENQGILYKFYEENKWSENHILSSKASKNYSVILFPDDRLSVLYEDLRGMLILSIYTNGHWTDNVIIKNTNKELYNIYFKATAYKSKVHIIFNILNNKTKVSTLFHQTLDEKNDLHDSKLIDNIKFNYNTPFMIYSSYSDHLYIMYQRYTNSHELGYRVFNNTNQEWSNFRVIDKSSYTFHDYSGIIVNDVLYALYIKKEKNIYKLHFIHDNHCDLKNTELFQNKNIDNCSIFIISGEIWCFWISNNEIYSSFSIDNGNSFSTFPYKNSINSSELFKATYMSNSIKEKNSILCNEIFFYNDAFLENFAYSPLYTFNQAGIKSTDYLSYIEYYMNEISLKIISYEKEFIQKELIISNINYQLKEQMKKNESYENKVHYSNEQYSNFLTLYNELNEKIKLFKQCLVDKDNEIKLLQDMNFKKDDELATLKNQIAKEKDKILFIVSEIKKLSDNFKNIHTNI